MRRSISMRGFTLVEVLVVVALLGVLMALLLPAVQAAREAARRTQCANHLRQLALGVHAHLDVTGRFPTGGWGYGWNGFPQRGNDRQQPGGWIYNVLPYIEQEALHALGGEATLAEQRAASSKRIGTPLPMLHCPSRRSALTFDAMYPLSMQPWHSDPVSSCARNDYAFNGGDYKMMHGPGPPDFATADAGLHVWIDGRLCTGLCVQRSEYRLADVLDGTSHTYLLGEKYLDPDHYATGLDTGDNEHAYSGDEQDLIRWTMAGFTPLRDRPGLGDVNRFGSAHAQGLNMVFGDGHLRWVRYGLGSETHRRLGHRADGEVVRVE